MIFVMTCMFTQMTLSRRCSVCNLCQRVVSLARETFPEEVTLSIWNSSAKGSIPTLRSLLLMFEMCEPPLTFRAMGLRSG